jgi:hypothetical protein
LDHIGRHEEHQEEEEQMTLLNEQERERFRKASARMQSASLPFMTYREGEFRLSGEPITGSEWLALPDKAVVGRYLFIEGNKLEAHEYFLRDIDGEPRRPNTFTDRSQWKLGSHNKPSDPWTAPQYTLYLVNPATNKPVEFKGTTADTRAAIARLLDDFRGDMRRPIVALRVIPRPENEKEKMPDFEIVSYSDNEEEIPGLNIVLRDDPPFSEEMAKSMPKAKPGGNDMDDEIPF